MSKDFNEKVVLISGASRGLGFAVAEACGASGAHVIALARTVGGLEELDDAIRERGGEATLVPLDITDDPALERLGAAIYERWGRLDLWVHTAQQAPTLAPVEHIDVKELDKVWAVNVRAVQRLIRVLDPLLRQAEAGRAVMFKDEGAAERNHHGLYVAAKAASDALVRDWGRTLEATSSARAILAAPPPMPTSLRGRFYPGEDRSALTHPSEVAGRLLRALLEGQTGQVDLRSQ